MSEENELPKGWCLTELQELSHKVQDGNYGGLYPKNHEWVSHGIPFLTPAAMDKCGNIKVDEVKYVTAEKNSLLTKAQLAPGDLIFPNRGSREAQRFGKELFAIKVPKNFSHGNINPQLTLVRPNQQIVDPDFLLNALNSEFLLAQVRRQTTGSALAFINLTVSKAFTIPIAPLPEQTRIVKKIEALQSRSKKAREALEKIPDLIEKFRQSVLAAAFRGDLTKEWREKNAGKIEPASELLKRIKVERRKKWEEEQLKKFKASGKIPKDDGWKSKYKEPEGVDTEGLPELPEGWAWGNLDDITTKIVDGTHHTPTYVPKGIPFISVKDIYDGKVHFDECKYISEKEHLELIKRCNPERGDLLVTKSGTIGRLAVIDTDVSFSLFVSVALLKFVPSNLSADWLGSVFSAWINTLNISADVKGTGVKNLHLVEFRKLNFPIPPVEEQIEANRILRIYEETFSRHQSLIDKLLLKVKDLDQSILAKAFRGELVPQDPNDEPVSVLLERIRKEREESAERKKGEKAQKHVKTKVSSNGQSNSDLKEGIKKSRGKGLRM